jgi:hypothetical protein
MLSNWLLSVLSCDLSQVARVTKFCAVAPPTSGCSVWNVLHITLLAPKILRWLLDFFWKNCCPLVSAMRRIQIVESMRTPSKSQVFNTANKKCCCRFPSYIVSVLSSHFQVEAVSSYVTYTVS